MSNYKNTSASIFQQNTFFSSVRDIKLSTTVSAPEKEQAERRDFSYFHHVPIFSTTTAKQFLKPHKHLEQDLVDIFSKYE